MAQPLRDGRQAAARFAGQFALIAVFLILLHAPLLRLPYFWDEAGYFIPAARDLLLTGDPIPQSTLSNAHPPLVAAYLALAWTLAGFSPLVTRMAMLVVAALALVGVFRLGKKVAHPEVAAVATVLTGLYPVFFMQSVMAHLDLAAAALTVWGLLFYLERRMAGAAALLGLAALAKETAIVTPLALVAWEMYCRGRGRKTWLPEDNASAGGARVLLLLLAAVPLAVWLAYHGQRTGHVLGNPEYVRYNVTATLDAGRMGLAALRRLWQVTGHMHLFVLTAAAALAMFRPAIGDNGAERQRIALPVQRVFAVVAAAHVAMLSVIGGAALARYMLPVAPLVILVCVSTLRRRMRRWRMAAAAAGVAFALGWFVEPPYPIAPEDTLAWRDYVELHQGAAVAVAARYPQARVLTAWPATDELTRPYLGYVGAPLRVLALEDFSPQQMAIAARDNHWYDVALVFSTKYEPRQNLLRRVPGWERAEMRYFGYHRDVQPQAAAALVGGRVVLEGRRGGEWVAVIEVERVRNAGKSEADKESRGD